MSEVIIYHNAEFVEQPKMQTNHLLRTRKTQRASNPTIVFKVPMSKSLETYLHDHLAAANMASDVLERLLKLCVGEESIRPFLDHLLVEFNEDKRALQQLANEVARGTSTIKDAAGWVGAKAVIAKVNSGKDNFGLFEVLEFLTVGIIGKLLLWKALQHCSSLHPALGRMDFLDLIARGESQYSEVERRRLHTLRMR